MCCASVAYPQSHRSPPPPSTPRSPIKNAQPFIYEQLLCFSGRSTRSIFITHADGIDRPSQREQSAHLSLIGQGLGGADRCADDAKPIKRIPIAGVPGIHVHALLQVHTPGCATPKKRALYGQAVHSRDNPCHPALIEIKALLPASCPHEANAPHVATDSQAIRPHGTPPRKTCTCGINAAPIGATATK